jgi:hypothetical protein
MKQQQYTETTDREYPNMIKSWNKAYVNKYMKVFFILKWNVMQERYPFELGLKISGKTETISKEIRRFIDHLIRNKFDIACANGYILAGIIYKIVCEDNSYFVSEETICNIFAVNIGRLRLYYRPLLEEYLSFSGQTIQSKQKYMKLVENKDRMRRFVTFLEDHTDKTTITPYTLEELNDIFNLKGTKTLSKYLRTELGNCGIGVKRADRGNIYHIYSEKMAGIVKIPKRVLRMKLNGS